MAVKPMTTIALDDTVLQYLKAVICEQNNIKPEDILYMKLVNGELIIHLACSVENVEINFTVN